MGKIIDRVRQREAETAARRRMGQSRREAARERALSEMMAKVFMSRQQHPERRAVCVGLRTLRGVHQLEVPATVPSAEVESCLKAQMDAINAREESFGGCD